MILKHTLLAALTGSGLLLLGAQQAAPRVLSTAQPGLWEITEPGSSKEPRRLCVRDLSALAQTEHWKRQCTRVVIADKDKMGVIHYTCTGGGFGRSTIEAVTPRNYRLVTQGIEGGLPFHRTLAARRVGNC